MRTIIGLLGGSGGIGEIWRVAVLQVGGGLDQASCHGGRWKGSGSDDQNFSKSWQWAESQSRVWESRVSMLGC